MFGPVVRAAGLPLIFYLHGPANGRHWLELWARRTQPRMVVCNSRFTAATVTNLYPETPAEVVYCPVAPAQFGPSETNTDRIRAELGTPKDATVIIQVSRMEAGKGHAVHLEALSLIKNLPGWICWQVGSPQQTSERKYLERLTKLADRAGISDRVVFVDRPANIRELLAAADIFCQPNTRPESFGIAFVEALYAQLPVVTTNIGGAREIIDDSCGLLIQPDDPQAVAAALRVLIEDGPFRQKLGTAGPKRARDLTDVHAQMARLRHCFLSAQNGNGKASRTGGRSA
jgi:glycosyltransferase involved in cell wall biosynthesis